MYWLAHLIIWGKSAAVAFSMMHKLWHQGVFDQSASTADTLADIRITSRQRGGLVLIKQIHVCFPAWSFIHITILKWAFWETQMISIMQPKKKKTNNFSNETIICNIYYNIHQWVVWVAFQYFLLFDPTYWTFHLHKKIAELHHSCHSVLYTYINIPGAHAHE